MIEDDPDDIGQADIYVLPPGDGQNSDGDSGDEECNGSTIDDEVLVYIVAQTERYVQQCGDHRFNTSVSEIRGIPGNPVYLWLRPSP